MEETKCYCGHTTYCDCGPEEPKQTAIEWLEEQYNLGNGFERHLTESDFQQAKEMEKKYVIKCFTEQTYYCGENYGWSKEAYLADYFDTIEDAENFIKREDGKFQIEVVYVV